MQDMLRLQDKAAPPRKIGSVLFLNIMESKTDFVYQFPWRGKLHELKLAVELPYKGNFDEFASRIVKAHSIPFHLEEDLRKDLERYVSRESFKHQDVCSDNIILSALENEQVMISSL